MPAVDFRQFRYYPCFQCSEPEQIAYRELSEEDKDAILPIVELSQIKYESSFQSTTEAVGDVFGNRPFILDLSKDAAPEAYVAKKNPDHAKIEKLQKAQDSYNEALLALMMAADGFSKWRECASQYANAIPVLQFTDPPVEDFIRDQGVWLSDLAGNEITRLQAIADKIRVLQDLENRHGTGSAIDLDHPFTSKALRINRTKRFLPDSAIANAQRYRSSQHHTSLTEGPAH